jgi:hypothetical protein
MDIYERVNSAQVKMQEDYSNLGQMDIIPSYKQRMKRAGEEGLLIFIKYFLVVVLAYFALTFGTQLVTGSVNGTQAALYLNELQNKGYLPKVVNGQVPPKTETPVASKN